MSACVEGKGNTAQEARTGLSMYFGADVAMQTLSVDDEGTVNMQLTSFLYDF